MLLLCEEKEREQEKLYELKREVLLREREQRLEEALDKQVGFITVHSSPLLKQSILISGPFSREGFYAPVACCGTILCISNIYFLLWHVVLSNDLNKCLCHFFGCPLWIGRKEKLESY